MNNKIEKGATEQQTKKKNIKPIYLGSIVLLVVILGVKFYLDYQEKKEMQAFYESELVAAEVKFAKISEELDEKIFEINSLGGEVSDLIAAKDSLRSEMDQLQRTRRANRALIQRLRAKTEGYEELLKAKDKQIDELRSINQALFTENTDLKTEQNQLNRSINELNSTKQKLEDKVAVASRLKVENLSVIAIAKNGKEREGSFRMKQIQQLKVEFNIAENNVAPIETKDIMIRVIDPNGQVIFDVTKGSGTFMLDGKEEFYTSVQTIVFDNSRQKLTFLYNKGSEYKTGQYTIEALTDGYKMGSSMFTVR